MNNDLTVFYEKKNNNFEQLVTQCIELNQYVGLGNPMSHVLLIGKEAGFDPNDKKSMEEHKQNATYFRQNLCGGVYAEQYVPPEGSNLRNYNHTWQKYQKLYDIIKGRKDPLPNYTIDFVSKVFTIELSDLPSLNTSDAKKDPNFKPQLAKRKKSFFESDFIRSFRVVVITALDADYIINQGEGDAREIDRIFEVNFDKEVPLENSKNKFWIHYSNNTNQPKLVIHTRQFTNGASNELLEKIGETIQKFMCENKIPFTV
ncbi:hypothetical protein [Microscilla marina]|uniref:Uncharacterized protein n=1 Tax=Microscilla marina ATCC 23134 TaxID=313606 RepID=A1ZMQ9_MICM2|nr:hypothetical protein [Microscilla marina]EAY28439.1 hypothetical protein M23134_04002 [Microscilla marina ATCC 23134]